MTTKTVLTSVLATFLVTAVGCGSSTPNATGAGGHGGTSAAGQAGSDGGAGTGTAGGGGAAAAGSNGGAGTSGGGGAAAAGSNGGAGTSGGGGAAAGSNGGAGTTAAGGIDGGAGAGSDAATVTDGGSDVASDVAADTASDVATSVDVGADTSADTAGACNALQLSGAQIAKVTHAGAAPTMTGGEIALGTYMMTNIDKYNGTQGSNTKRETWVFTAGHFEVVGEDSADGQGVQHHSGSFSVAGNVLTLTLTCPAAAVVTTQYTSADGKISTLSEPQSTDQEIHTITKQ